MPVRTEVHGGVAQVSPQPERVEDQPLVTNDWFHGSLVAAG